MKSLSNERMTDLNLPRRHLLRLQGFDYSQPNAYFVTIVLEGRKCLLGDIFDGEMHPSDAGRMIEKWWNELTNKFHSIELDDFTIMPNHFHGLLWLVGADLGVGPGLGASSDQSNFSKKEKVSVSLPAVMQWFKTMTTNEYIRGVKLSGWTPFPGKLWQRNYYDHVVRDDIDLDNIRRYIKGNPILWEQDNENPHGAKSHS